VQIVTPSIRLKPFVKHYVFVSTGSDMQLNTLLPDTSVALAFRVRGTTSYVEERQKTLLPASVLTGLRTSPRRVHYESHSATLIVVFHPLTAGYFFCFPIHEIFNLSVSLADVIRRDVVSAAEDRLSCATSLQEMTAVLEEFLLSQLQHSKDDALVSNAVSQIVKTSGQARMRELASDLCISQDAFEKRFRKITGSSPKHFAKTIRLRSIVTDKDKNKSITERALDAGYFDSAHFNKDFRSFTGQSPTEFFRSPRFW
jgi:AraC-like DNA-binding protein